MSYSSRAYTTFQETMRVRGLRITPSSNGGDRGYVLSYAFPLGKEDANAYAISKNDEADSLSMSGIESIEDVIRDTVEQMEMEVVILPATAPRVHSALAREIFAACKP
jgi:hypothetical protein